MHSSKQIGEVRGKSETLGGKAVDRLSSLACHFDKQECNGENCDLRFYHQARASIRSDSSVKNIFVPDKYPVRAAGLTSRTRWGQRQEETGEDSSEECVIESPRDNVFLSCDEKLKFFTSELFKDLQNKVVDDLERDLIGKTAVILEMKKIVGEMKHMKLTPDIYSENSYPRFKEAVECLHIPGLDFSDDSILKSQYKNYIKLISSLDSSEECVIDARKVIMRLLNSSEKLYEGIQVVNHIITVAATKSTTESVIESYVSMFEYNNNSRKNYTEQAMRDSFAIQKDGPLVTR